jgi:rubrerythrin
MMTEQMIEALDGCRRAEKEQALFYRTLAAEAEEQGDEALSERLQQLHADEQHHLSRLTARLLELGRPSADAGSARPAVPALAEWEAEGRRREQEEVRRYEVLLERQLDPATQALVEQILEVERAHARELGGKWTMA